jgi:hypothetical protein
MAQITDINKTSLQFIYSLSNISVDPTSPVFAPMTMGIFVAAFPIWGNLVLSAVVAVAISMVFYDSNYQWIKTQQPGVVHNLCDYVYLAIQVVLHAHKEDYPNNPVEPGALQHLPFIIQSVIDEAVAYKHFMGLCDQSHCATSPNVPCGRGFELGVTAFGK